MAKACQKFEVIGKTGRGRNRKTWIECVKTDMKDKGLNASDAQNREAWRNDILGEKSNPCMHGKTDSKMMMMIVGIKNYTLFVLQ